MNINHCSIIYKALLMIERTNMLKYGHHVTDNANQMYCVTQ